MSRGLCTYRSCSYEFVTWFPLGFILGKPKYVLVCSVNSTVSIRVRREVVELADKMVRYELARSRSHAFNILIEKGLSEVVKEVGFWKEVYRDVEELQASRSLTTG